MQKSTNGPYIVYVMNYHHERKGPQKTNIPHMRHVDGSFPDEEQEQYLSEMVPRLITCGKATFVVSDVPVPEVATISQLEIIEDEGKTLASGRVHSGFAKDDFSKLVRQRLTFLVTEFGEILIPADSVMAPR